VAGTDLVSVGVRLRVSAGDLEDRIDRIDPGMRYLLNSVPYLGTRAGNAVQLLLHV